MAGSAIKRQLRRGALLASATAMGLPFGAHAQSEAVAEDAGEQTDDAIPVIIVTAERREQALQDTSLAIQVVTAQELERANLTQVHDLNTLVPGLQIGSGGNAPQIYIRGVGDFAASALSNPAVAVNIDGVYVARPQAVNSLFYDLQRIEVLKGPQGTLYGRNASGGAINLISNRPSLAGLDGYIGLTYGNYDNKQLEAAVNVPLGQTVAARLAFFAVDRDGYLSDGTDDDERVAGRLRVLWEPNASTSLLLNADYASESGNGPGYVMLPGPPGTDEWTSTSSPQANAQLAAQPPIGFLLPPTVDDSFRDNKFWNVSAEFNTDLGFATLTVLPAYRHAEYSERNYPAGLRNTLPGTTAEQVSVETRLGNSTDRLTWTVGGYFFDERQDSEQQIFQGIFQDNRVPANIKIRSYAAFGQATVSPTDAFRLIGGLRYTYERNRTAGAIFTFVPPFPVPPEDLPVLQLAFGGRTSFDALTWRAGAEFDVTPDSMLFATVSTGFKAGGFNQTIAPDDVYDPEKITAFEIGSRNTFLDGRLIVNFEGFWWKLRDAQIAHVKFDPAGNINLVTDNAGEAEIKGANVELRAALSEHDSLRFFAEYNHAEYTDFRYDTAFSIFGAPLFNPLSTGCAVSAPFPGSTFGTQAATINCSGFQMPRAPKWSGAATYAHTFDLPRGDTIVLDGTMQFASSRWLGFDYVEPEHVGGYATFDANLTYTSPNLDWSVAAFARNIGDEAVYTGAGVHAFAPPLTYATIAPPRTYGVRLRYNFGN
jgi:iron complex outermembrane receptor protein